MSAAELDLSEFKRLGHRNQRKPCGVAEAAAKVPAEDQPRVLAAFESEDEDVRRGVKRWLENREIDLPNDSAVTTHRRKRCACHAQ